MNETDATQLIVTRQQFSMTMLHVGMKQKQQLYYFSCKTLTGVKPITGPSYIDQSDTDQQGELRQDLTVK